MSFDFRTINKSVADPILGFIADLQKQAGLFLAKEQVGQLADSEDIYSDSNDIETKVSLNTLLLQHVFRFDKVYYAPKDPGRMATCWLRGYNMGSELRDFSQFNHPAIILGEPLLVDGVIDLGIYDESVNLKSTALRFNRPTSPDVNLEALQIPDHTDLQITTIPTSSGFSIFMRFKTHSIANEGGQTATMCEKTDDATPNYGYMVKITNTGRIVVHWNINGTNIPRETASGVAQADSNKTWMMFVTFNKTGASAGTILCYFGEDTGSPLDTMTLRTLSVSADVANWHSTSSNHDVNVFRRGVGSAGGHIYGDLYDWEFYRPDSLSGHNGIVSSTEVDNRASNKMSISDIPYGCVMIANHWATSLPAALASFTSASFTSTSFTT